MTVLPTILDLFLTWQFLLSLVKCGHLKFCNCHQESNNDQQILKMQNALNFVCSQHLQDSLDFVNHTKSHTLEPLLNMLCPTLEVLPCSCKSNHLV